MKRTLMLLLGGAVFLGFAASARADLIVGSDDFCQSNGNACLLGGEQKIFLQAQTNTMLGFGNVGGQDLLPIVDIHSDGGRLDMFIDLANGFSTIKPHNGISFNGVDISIPGFTFTELIFHVQLTTATEFDVQGFADALRTSGLGLGLLEFAGANSDDEYRISALNGARFNDVDISALGGFDEIKQLEIGGVLPNAVPEPSSLMLMGTFGAMMAGAGFWRRRRTGAPA
jgi:hypothetical protein